MRRVRSEEWEALRDVRVRALAGAPDAFGTTHAEALARPDAWWIEWAQRSSESDEQAMVLAWDGGAAVGIAGVFRHDDGEGWQVISMWVDPSYRGRGVARALLEVAVAFAEARGAGEVILSVTDGNDSARGLYESYGFADTGVAEPLRSNPALTVRDMRLSR
ncbi:MAG TPA: N-acetyltransferase [Gaiellaceae bacterium]